MDITFGKDARFWVGAKGNELLGLSPDGTPITADDDGVEPMREITEMITGLWTD